MPAIFEQLFSIIGVIDNLVQFGQLVASISGSDPQSLAATETALEAVASKIETASAEILTAVSNLDQEVFRAKMADRLSDVDQAGVALSEWRTSKNALARQQALNTSEAGLAGIVELYSNDVYPGPSMVAVLTRVVLMRLAVLDTFPSERSPADTSQLRAALQAMITSTDAIAAPIQAQNRVIVKSAQEDVHGRPPRTFYSETISYTNILGNKTYDHTVLSSISREDAQNQASSFIATANEVAAQGLAADLDHAQVTKLRQIIQTIQPVVG